MVAHPLQPSAGEVYSDDSAFLPSPKVRAGQPFRPPTPRRWLKRGPRRPTRAQWDLIQPEEEGNSFTHADGGTELAARARVDAVSPSGSCANFAEARFEMPAAAGGSHD